MSARAALLAAMGGLAGGGGPQGADVDLAKAVPPADGGWSGRRVGEVLDVASIERIVLLKALTSTTAAHDLANIRRILGAAAARPFEGPAPKALLGAWPEESVWDAVIVAGDGRIFGFSADARRACLRAADGRSGCFGTPAPAVD
ncbi:hypothetical protein [Pseudoxanthomonas sp. 10H]|uniref:hypothetical protein n=1 Tax=Pseudoxanthomonas sp. 10H TaxID=3242729 RepID=UPI003557D86D